MGLSYLRLAALRVSGPRRVRTHLGCRHIHCHERDRRSLQRGHRSPDVDEGSVGQLDCAPHQSVDEYSGRHRVGGSSLDHWRMGTARAGLHPVHPPGPRRGLREHRGTHHGAVRCHRSDGRRAGNPDCDFGGGSGFTPATAPPKPVFPWFSPPVATAALASLDPAYASTARGAELITCAPTRARRDAKVVTTKAAIIHTTNTRTAWPMPIDPPAMSERNASTE